MCGELINIDESKSKQKKITEAMGWVCPLCKKVNAPWIPNCDCIDKKNDYIEPSYTTTEY